MTRQDLVFVSLKVIGLYLLARAILAAGALLSAVGTVTIASRASAVASDDANLERIWDMMQAHAVSQAWASLTGLILFSVVGIYLVRWGGAIRRLTGMWPKKAEESAA